MNRIALFGATGALGRCLAAALASQERPYRVVGRHAATLQKQFGADPRAELVTWNPDDPESVRKAAEGIDTLIYLVGVPYHRFELHPQLMRKTLEGAIAAGVRDIVLIATVYPYGIPQTNPVREDHPRVPNTFKGRMRAEQENILLQAQAEGKIRATILRLPDFYGPGVENSFLYDAFAGAVQNRRANVVGPIDTPHEFIYVPDAARTIVRIADRDDALGQTWHIGGPGTITVRDFVTRIYTSAGSTPRMLVANKRMLQALGLFNPMMRELVEMNYLQTTPVVLDDSALRALLGDLQKTSYDDGIMHTLDATREATPV